MPYKKFKKSGRRPKRQYRKGKFSKKFKGRFRMNHRPKLSYSGPGRAPLPDMYFTKLHFQDWYNVASGGITGLNDQVMRGNSPYDPDFTGVGRGCNGYTELASIYNYYRVYASKISVQFKSIVDTTATGDFVALLFADRSSSTYTMANVTSRQGNPFNVTRLVNRYANGDTPTTLKQYRKTKHIYGESEIDDDAYASTVSSSPANSWFWHVIAARGDQSAISAAPGVQMLIRITYYVRFERRGALAAP